MNGSIVCVERKGNFDVVCIWGFPKLHIVIFRWLVRGSRGQNFDHNMKFTTISGEGKHNISNRIKRKDIETKPILVH